MSKSFGRLHQAQGYEGHGPGFPAPLCTNPNSGINKQQWFNGGDNRIDNSIVVATATAKQVQHKTYLLEQQFFSFYSFPKLT